MGDLSYTAGGRFGPFSEFAEQFPLIGRAAGWLIWPVGLSTFYSVYRFLFVDRAALGMDGHAYWLATQGPLEYSRIPGQMDAFLYSPAFLAAIRPLGGLPWEAFHALWIILQAAALFWLLWPMAARWAIPASFLAIPELFIGNIYLFLAVAAVLAARYPAVWSFAFLTKVAPGVGVLWTLVRKEWKAFGIALGVTAAIVGVGWAADPQDWNNWFVFLLANRSGTPDSPLSYIARLIFAVVLVVLAARLNWSFLIAPAMLLASPVVAGISPLVLLLAIPRLAIADGLAASPTLETEPAAALAYR